MSAVVSPTDAGLEIGLLATGFALGLRHGIDWDHLAALFDITSLRQSTRSSLLLATLYALGHAAVVFGLGLLAITAGSRLPPGVDRVMERFVGASLIVMAIYLLYAVVRDGRDFRMQSRWSLLLRFVQRAVERVRRRASSVAYLEIEHDHEHPANSSHGHQHAELFAGASSPRAAGSSGPTRASSPVHRHLHRHRAPMPPDPFLAYGPRTSVVIGVLHGIGAETPTQLLVFVTAAGVAGRGPGMLLLLAFVLGLLISNSLIAMASIFGFRRAERAFVLYAALGVLTATFSLITGALLLAGSGGRLPAILGG